MILCEELSNENKLRIIKSEFELARRRLMDFSFCVNPSYQYARHLEFLAEVLEKVERGEIKKLMIFFAPRHGKSEMTSCNFPAWYLGRNPDKRIIHASYADSLSNEWSRRTRDIVEDEIFRAIFGISTDKDVRAVDNWRMAGHRGGVLSLGVGGSATGRGADLFIIDDPVKNAQEAESETFRARAYDWYRSVARTRLEPGASMILMMARWHQKDLAGSILEEDADWTVINLKAIAGENDPMGRKAGEPLWPERFDAHSLEQIKKDIGSRYWNALYDGEPVDPEGAIIKRHWIQYYESAPIKARLYGGIDTATSKKTSADNMALVEVCRDKDGFLYVDDVFLDKVSVTEFATFVNGLHRQRKFSRINIESNNAGEAVKQRIDEVGREPKTGSHPPLSAITTDTDKVVRVIEFQHMIENGTIKFKSGNPRVAKLIDHLCAFDGRDGADDDDVDALGFAIKASESGERTLVH